jgi:ribosomal protein S18 acetylase RimI-like enzyme
MNEYIKYAFSKQKIEGEILNRDSMFYFIKNDEEVMGYTKFNINNAQTEFKTDFTFEIERIYVREKYKAKKLGFTFVQYAVKKAKELGKKEVWLGVWEKNINAIEFYKKCGFHIDGEHAFFMGNDKQNDYIMKIKLEET